MTTTTYRPGSLISASRLESSLSAPPGPGHYTLKRISYISELPASESFVPRPRSLLRSASFTMGFGFKDKEKGKEKKKEHKQPPNMPVPALSAPAPAFNPVKDKSTTSRGLFSSLNKSKGLKKKRSLSSLLDGSTSTTARPSAPRASRARSSDAASTLPSIHKASNEKRLSPEKQSSEKQSPNDYRQLDLRPTSPEISRSKPKNRWMRRYNMRLHTDYDACYMQAYDPVLLENDRQFELLLHQLNPLQNPSFHDFTDEEPISVLDLGCGAGSWLIEAASYWKQAIVTGVDMVDILVPEARDHHQINFIQGNFLVFPWPFPSRSFDFVRMANLSLCIPYDKWELILSEIYRVLTINGRFELIDDQISFPYAPAPISRPVYEVEDEDDVASVKSDSTLVSDGDTSQSQHTRRQSSISASPSDTPKGIPQQFPFPALSGADLPSTAASVHPIQKSQPDWNAGAAACRDVEIVFQNMLHKRFGIHSQPSQFAPEVIQHVFGNVKKSKSYHLKLAPKDVHKQFGGVEAKGVASLGKEESVSDSKRSSRNKWFCPDKEEKKRTKRTTKPSTPTSTGRCSPTSDTPVPEGLDVTAGGRLGITGDTTVAVSRIPESVSAKAAYRLGIPMSDERAVILSRKESTPPDAVSDIRDNPSLSSTPPAPIEPVENNRQSIIALSASSGDSKLSAKAANRLGISYSELSEAAALAKASAHRPVSSSSTLVADPTPPVQSPGLIVWPNRFIPMSPEELEMHALKNVHMLIGCKPALMDYIRTFLDKDGNRVTRDEEFEQALWDFRRRRFNWPADIPSDWEADGDVDAQDSVSTPAYKLGADTPASANSAAPRNPMLLSSMPDTFPLDKIDELIHVRTIRVFEAVKTEEYTLSTMKNPRPSPPNPRR